MACCSSWGPKFGSQHVHWILIMSALMNLMSSSGLWGYLHTHANTHTHIDTHTNTVIIIKGLKCIDGSVVQLAWWSSWGPKLGSENLHWILIMSALMNLMSSSGLWGYLNTYAQTHTHTHTRTQTHTHRNTVIIINGLKWIDGSVVHMACSSSWVPKLVPSIYTGYFQWLF